MGIVGILVTVIFGYFGIRGWKRKKPTYLVRSNNIFSGLERTVPDVEVKFRGYGELITALTVTKIAFWNAGNDTLKKQDVVKDDPITIRGKEGTVFLSASVSECVLPLNKIDCKLNQDRSQVTITFEYLDHNQGANMQVFHTGTSNADITMRGTIMGASPIRRHFLSNAGPQPPIWLGYLPLSILWVFWGLFALGILPTRREPVPPFEGEAMSVEGLGLVLLGFTVGIGSFHYFTYIPKPFSKIFRQ
jgi:hypothetical protein